MSKRAAIYARVSTDLQRDNYSIPTQVAEIKKYADKQGYTLVGDQYVNMETGHDTIRGEGTIPAFVDDYSSRELSRPGLDAAQRYLDTAGFDVLIVHSLDRLARDPYIRQTLERDFVTRGARIEFVLGNYEETPEGEVRKDLDATFAKWENAKRVERCNRGKRRKAESGLFVSGRPPFGYIIDRSVPGGLRVDETEAEVVRRIFSLYVHDGYSIRQITRVLSEGKTQPQLGGQKWAKTSVLKILMNTAYLGYCYYNKNKQAGKKLIQRDTNEWIKIPIVPIIDPWTFEQAKKRVEENRITRRVMSSRFYLLTSMVFCEQCGRPYITQTAIAGKNRRINDASTYRHRVSEGHCINRTISARKLEPLVWAKVAEMLRNPDMLRKGYYDSLQQQEYSRTRQIAHLETLRKGIIKLEKERQKLTELYLDPDINMTKIEYYEQKNRIDDQIKSTVNEIGEKEAELASVPTPADLETLEIFASKIRARLAENYVPPAQEQRHIFELLHIKVVLRLDGTIKVNGWYREENEGEMSSDCLLDTMC